MLKDHLKQLVESGMVSEVKWFLLDNSAFHVNEVLDYGDYRRALHIACHYGHHEIVSLLLAHPDIYVNQKDKDGYTPLILGCSYGQVEVVKVLLKDSRVDINMADDMECTPVWHATHNVYLEVIKWMIALRGDELDIEKKGKLLGCTEYTILEISSVIRGSRKLLERFIADPNKTRHKLRVEFGLVNKDVSSLFAAVVFLCDDFVTLKGAITETARFFSIIRRLPMELQMIICHRVYGSSKNSIKSSESEPAFKDLAKYLLQ